MTEFTSTSPNWLPQFNLYKKLKKILNLTKLMPSYIDGCYLDGASAYIHIFNGNGRILYELENRSAIIHYQRSAMFYDFLRNSNDAVYISLSKIGADGHISNKEIAISNDQISHLRENPTLVDKMNLDSSQIRHLKMLSMSFPEILLKYGLSRIR